MLNGVATGRTLLTPREGTASGAVGFPAVKEKKTWCAASALRDEGLPAQRHQQVTGVGVTENARRGFQERRPNVIGGDSQRLLGVDVHGRQPLMFQGLADLGLDKAADGVNFLTEFRRAGRRTGDEGTGLQVARP